jgi:class 3 adenylate cyclase
MMRARHPTGGPVPRPQAKSFAAPDDVRDFPLAHIESVNLDETHVGRCRFAPGWRWSEAMAPLLGVASCPMRHLGYTISGSLHVAMDDGQVLDVGPGSVFDIPAGHDKWVVGDEPWVTVEWGGSGRAMGEALNEAPGRTLATVVFTDIVDSTRRLRDLGDSAWRDLLASHNGRMRETLNIYRGREVASTGDGFLALFDSPTRAVRAATAMVAASRAMEIEIRVGVHTGEVERIGDDVRGIAVHLAARVMANAGPGQVLITATTAELIDGSGIRLEDAGTHALKGIDGPRRLLSASDSRLHEEGRHGS